jgi:hypothetical protein
MSVDEITDLPPSYEIVMGNGFDIPPPPYHSISIEEIKNSSNNEMEINECPKYITIQHV